jgi:hypothetical protein
MGGVMFKKDLLYVKSCFFQWGLFCALMAGVFLAPVAKAEISDAIPTSIPKEISDVWTAQGGAAADITNALPADLKAKCDGTLNSAYHYRRVARIRQFPFLNDIMFTRHHNLGAIAIGFWVNCGSSDVSDTDWKTQGALCRLTFTDNYYPQMKEILAKTDMCVRDLCISLDGKKAAFAMSSGKGKGYSLYETKIDDPTKVTQLTQQPSGLTVADNEPCYLPNGDIMFESTRCFGVIDCGWQPTSNLFIMDSTGKYIRRVGYDQVHTFYPVLRGEGTVMYTRWEYNDRDIAKIAGVFTVNPDGSHQTELFGNQTTWPMVMQQSRPTPGFPSLFLGVASGHHGDYSGEVFQIDISKGRNGPANFKMISPPRETKTRDADAFANGGIYRNSEYPYPLNDQWYLVSYCESTQPQHNSGAYKIYLKNVDGKQQELLAWGSGSLHDPVVVAPWKDIWGNDPVKVARQANFNDSMATITMSNVYYGEGMKGIDKSTGIAKKIRVVEVRYRVSGACENGWAGMISGSHPSDVNFAAPDICPVAAWGGSWDVKSVVGTAKIYPDGSASFKVPARMPVYFQVLDSNDCAIADMRSWATLMPGEKFSCYGCHEDKNVTPPAVNSPQASVPQTLDKPLGVEGQGFDFPKMVQPILDKSCKSCHTSGHSSGFDFTGTLVSSSAAKKSYATSYTSLFKGIGASKSNKAINIATIFSQAPQMPPNSYGARQSGMIKDVISGSMPKGGTKLSANDIGILAAWVDLEAPHGGTYDAYMPSSDAQKYKQLEATAQKWFDIEAKNSKDYAAWQKTQPSVFVNNPSVAAFIVKQLKIKYLPKMRVVALGNVSQGTFKLTDLRGKVISSMKMSNQNAGNVRVSLPKSLSAGLYIARFEGVNGIEQAKISITQ